MAHFWLAVLSHFGPPIFERDHKPDESFWNALKSILLAIENNAHVDKSIMNQEIKLLLNSNGRLTFSVRDPKLDLLKEILSCLSICSLFIPTYKQDQGFGMIGDCKLKLETYSNNFQPQVDKIVFHLKDISEKEFLDIYYAFFKMKPGFSITTTGKNGNIFGKSIHIYADLITKDEGNNNSEKNPADFYEHLSALSKRFTDGFLRVRSGFEIESNVYIKTPVLDEINRFMKVSQPGMIVIGSSGSGKTKTIQNFIKNTLPADTMIFATSPKTGHLSAHFGLSIFFSEYLKKESQESFLQIMDTLLQGRRQKMLLLVDGLNELSGGSDICAKHQKSLIELVHLIAELKISTIKVIITCRDYAFLDYCQATDTRPTLDTFYCKADHRNPLPYYKIPELTLELQKQFASEYFSDADAKHEFVSALENNSYYRKQFVNPYMIAIASQHYVKAKHHSLPSPTEIFSTFTVTMMNRLSDRKSIHLAETMIDSYFSLLLNASPFSRCITRFLLVNTYNNTEKENVLDVLPQLYEINLLGGGNNGDYLTFSHDRIEEYLLGEYLYNHAMNMDILNRAISCALEDQIILFGVQAYFNKCIQNKRFAQLIKNILDWNTLNQSQIPILLIKAISELRDQKEYNAFFDQVKEYCDLNLFFPVIIRGLESSIASNDIEFFELIHQSILDATTDDDDESQQSLKKYVPHLYYLAAKFQLTIKNDRLEARRLCEKALNQNNIYKMEGMSDLIELLEVSLLEDQEKFCAGASKLEKLYDTFSSNGQWEYAAETLIAWGSILRDATSFRSAIEVYDKIDITKIENSFELQAKLYRKKGAAYKNIMQQLLRKSNIKNITEPEKDEILKYYRRANFNYDKAKKSSDKAYNSIEKFYILSEQAESSIKVIPLMPDQREYAELYQEELGKILSYLLIPDCRVLFLRIRSLLEVLDGEYEKAIESLLHAKALAHDNELTYRVFECNYRIGNITEKHWSKMSDHAKYLKYAMICVKEAIDFGLDPDNEYRKTCEKVYQELQSYSTQ